MNQIFIVFMNGLTYAGLLFMCASGLTLIFGLMQIVNMSHGIFYLVGAYAGLTILGDPDRRRNYGIDCWNSENIAV